MKKTLEQPLDAIVFDCDGTLSQIEGIDYLAKINGVEEAVCQLTHTAMTQTGISASLYAKRLDFVKPTLDQIKSLAQIYFDHISPDVVNTISILQKLHKKIYIFSAGVNPAVQLFGAKLNVLKENIFAVDLQFDAQGHYIDFDHHSVLTTRDGKKKLIHQLPEKRIGYIGDGMNDVAVMNDVTRFIGYGGAYYRDNIKKIVPFYSEEKSFLALLPLLLTENELQDTSRWAHNVPSDTSSTNHK